MTPSEVTKAKKFIQENYYDKSPELEAELDRYVNTNNARNGNKLTFVNLSEEVRMAIVKTKGSSTGRIVNKR